MLVNCKSESETDIMTCKSIELKVKTHCSKIVGQLKKVKLKTDIMKTVLTIEK